MSRQKESLQRIKVLNKIKINAKFDILTSIPHFHTGPSVLHIYSTQGPQSAKNHTPTHPSVQQTPHFNIETLKFNKIKIEIKKASPKKSKKKPKSFSPNHEIFRTRTALSDSLCFFTESVF